MEKCMSKNKTEKKRLREKKIIFYMISLYCHKNHKTKKGLCNECQSLLSYSEERSDKCPFMENKSFCSNCQIHCYKPEMREKIRRVMRFSGPRMILKHPIMAIRHVISSKREKRQLEGKNEG